MTEKQYSSIVEVLTSPTPVKYVPHGHIGGWAKFMELSGDQANKWDIPACLLALACYMLGRADPTVVISQMFEGASDDAPSHKMTIFNLTEEDLLKFDAICQPSWFEVVIKPIHGKYDLVLLPTRSLTKLLYKYIA